MGEVMLLAAVFGFLMGVTGINAPKQVDQPKPVVASMQGQQPMK